MLELILERSGTLHEQDFVDKLADFGSRPRAQRVLYMQGLTTAALGKLTRPGAWLLDYVYTVISVIYGDAKPSVLSHRYRTPHIWNSWSYVSRTLRNLITGAAATTAGTRWRQ